MITIHIDVDEKIFKIGYGMTDEFLKFYMKYLGKTEYF